MITSDSGKEEQRQSPSVKKNERIPQTKLVIRRLPPSMSEEEFLSQVSPLSDYDFLCYIPADNSLGQNAFCRAYINFLNHDDLVTFRDKFDNYVFLDKNGHEYMAVVEYSMWHKSPKSGPFYHGNKTTTTVTVKTNGEPSTSIGSQNGQQIHTIEQDKDYLEFLERLDKQKRRCNNVPSSTLEANLDELTNSSSSNKNNAKVMTPLLEYVKQSFSQRRSKNSTRVSSEKKK